MAVEAVPARRVVLGADVVLTYEHGGSDGEPATPGGTPTVSVVDSSGEVVTVGSVSGSSSTYSATVSAADSPRTDLWSVTWTADSADHEEMIAVVGGVYATTARIRALEPSLGDVGKYPAEVLLEKREIAEFEVEQITDRAFVPRFSVARRRGGSSGLVLPEWDVRSVRWVRTVNADSSVTDWTAERLALVDVVDGGAGVIGLRSGCWPDVVEVGFEFGLDRPPNDLETMVAKRTRWFANRPNSTVPDRATSYTVDGGTYRIQTEGEKRTGDDAVDAVYARWSRMEIVVG